MRELETSGIKLVSNAECAADTLTAAYYPDNIEDVTFRSGLRQCGVVVRVVAATIGPIKGKGFRVGHIGNVSQARAVVLASEDRITIDVEGIKVIEGFEGADLEDVP